MALNLSMLVLYMYDFWKLYYKDLLTMWMRHWLVGNVIKKDYRFTPYLPGSTILLTLAITL